MLERLKSLPLTIVLTILIWMYAESQVRLQSDEFERVPFSVIYRPSPHNERLIALSSPTVTITITTQDITKLGGVDKIHIVALPKQDISALEPDTDQRVPVNFAIAESPGTIPIPVTFEPPEGTAYIHTPPATTPHPSPASAPTSPQKH